MSCGTLGGILEQQQQQQDKNSGHLKEEWALVNNATILIYCNTGTILI